MEPSRRTSVGSAALLLGLVFWLVVIWAWRPSVLTLTVDDSFYYLKIALNIAGGYGATFDRLNPTNGFHPLWMAILTVPAAIVREAGDTLAQVALTLQALLVFGGAYMLSRSGFPAARSFGWVFATFFTNFYFAKILVNGQESSLVFFMICACLSYRARAEAIGRSTSTCSAAILGVLGGLTALSRLEAGLFAAALVAMPVLWPSAADRGAGARSRWIAAAVGALALALVVAPYYLMNIVYYHHLTPVAAALKIGERAFKPALAALLACCLIGALVARYAARAESSPDRASGRAVEFLRLGFPLFFYVATLTAVTLVVRGRGVAEIWYFPAHALTIVLVLCLLLEEVPSRRARAFAVPALVVSTLAFSALCWTYRLDPLSYEAYMAARRSGEWLKRNTPENAIVAGWDCGISSYYSDRRVIPLDGLVNSWDFKENYLDKRRTGEFINNVHRVDYMVQHFRVDALRKLALGKNFDLLPFFVARAEIVPARLITARGTLCPLCFVVLSRDPLPRAPTFREYCRGLR